MVIKDISPAKTIPKFESKTYFCTFVLYTPVFRSELSIIKAITDKKWDDDENLQSLFNHALEHIEPGKFNVTFSSYARTFILRIVELSAFCEKTVQISTENVIRQQE